MVSANASIVPPPGQPREVLETWSFACATGNHDECKGRRINPDPDCDPDDVALPCGCTVNSHHEGQTKGRGRPRKTTAE
ncbi:MULTISPECIES: hypothetical protein [Nonomuraea]|uniref:Uncharacterized protein n=1 Tax=Nonomuraea africana TaxID=46171 RepID=A0ABR9KXP1_9ACTN|nr:hypothetical protein [Nonomuraea africana]MBE1566535.1 hypothetical protein [Nonomuraea africana]